ncbi:MAG: hypothetical protein WC410_02560 [Candidatus Paceibacterota bacterium]|jgi:hypothetical protein
MISEKALKEYKAIYKKEYGVDLSDEEALEQATKLLNLMKIIYKPISKEDYEKLQKRREETKG